MNAPEVLLSWERAEGPALLRACGVSDGCRVLDFGFGQGHYSVAAANAAGPAGKIFALDRDLAAIEAFRERVVADGIGNIEILGSQGGAIIPLQDDAADFMMLYDVIYAVKDDWIELMAEAHRVLRCGGVLSVLPFHMEADAVGELFAKTQQAEFSKPVLLSDAGLHIGMAYRASQENPDTDLKGAERGTVYNFTRI